MEKIWKNKVIIDLLEQYKSIWALEHLSSLAWWDLQTYMSEKGVESRSLAMSKVNSMIQELYLNKDFTDLVEKANKEKNLNDYERGLLRVINWKLKQYKCLPKAFLEEYSKITAEATKVWSQAKKENNFSIFSPVLEKIVDLSRKKAKYFGYKDSPYDALLDEFEENLTSKEVESFFSKIKPKLLEILAYVKKSPRYKENNPLEKAEYDIDKAKEINLKVLNILKIDDKKIRLDIAPHPFCMRLSLDDCRITTRYEGKNILKTISSTIHEFGHALYDTQGLNEIKYAPLAGGVSLIIHESQSRLWENIIGRSKEFLTLIHKDLIEKRLISKEVSIDDLYKLYNTVKPGLIRVDADELTYHFHIMIRYEIEKDLIEGKIEVKDLPRIWNDKYKSYLGVEPPTDTLGVLQDIHWSHGGIGYFPTYSMGSFLSGMIIHYMEKDLGKIGNIIASQQGINKIQNWLKEKLHQYGATYDLNDFLNKQFKDKFNPSYFLEYLENKYKTLY